MSSVVRRVVRTVFSKVGLLVGVLGIAVLAGVVAAAAALPAVGAAVGGTDAVAAAVPGLSRSLPALDVAGVTTIEDSQGHPVAHLFVRDQVSVPLAQVSPVMRTAQVDIEDQRFYQHGAVDLQGLLRAAVSNLRAGGTVAGGSTLTQQYVKNVLVTEASTPAAQAAARADSLARKATELRYAIGVEKSMTKDQILQGYLNIATYGRSVYGVQAAAEYFFGIPAARLDLAQAAMIAGLTKSPSTLDPTGPVVGLHDPRKDARVRRDVVLDKMYALGHISRAAWTAARASGLGIANGGRGIRPPQGCVASSAPWYCDYVEQLVLHSPDFAVLGPTVAARRSALFQGGLTIRTALDPSTQRRARAGIEARSNPTDQVVAATAVVQPGTGAVLAVANSKTYDPAASSGSGGSALDYAVPAQYGGARGFQPGSSMKSFTAAAALAGGDALDYTIDSPARIDVGGVDFATCSGRPYRTPTYRVRNASSSEAGTFTMNEALQRSVNTYFVQLEQQIGICAPWQLATAAGITQPGPGGRPVPFDQYASFTLGVDDTSPLQMSEAYAMFAAGGSWCAPLTVTSITRAGRSLYSRGPSCRQLIPSGVADAVAWSLFHNVQGDQFPGTTAAGLATSGIPFAAKTGTNTGGTGGSTSAVWFNGFNAQFAASVVVGDATSNRGLNGQRFGGRVISNASGADLAGSVWRAVMIPILRRQTRHPGFADPSARYAGTQLPAVGALTTPGFAGP